MNDNPNKTAHFFYLCVVILRCIWDFHNAHAKQQIPGSSNYRGKYTSGIKNFEIVFPQRVSKDGSFISHLVQHYHSKRSTNEIEYIFYKIPIGGKDYLIELTPNRKLIAPGAVVEIRKKDTRKSSKRYCRQLRKNFTSCGQNCKRDVLTDEFNIHCRKFVNEINPNETLRKMFENLEIKRLENTECHFSGHVKGENISKAALSTCYGLAGFIQIKKRFYTIEPVAEHDPFIEESYPHILYKEDGLENSSSCQTIRQMEKSLLDKVVRKRRDSYIGSSVPMFAETLIVIDKTMINYHRDLDCENYVLTVFNMAFNLFRDASVGMLMTLTVVRIIRLEVEDDQMNLNLNGNAEKILRYFQTWQYEINPGDDTHPNHHDIALLLTRVNVCYSSASSGILGLTTIGKACDPKQSAALCEDSGLRLGYVIAHEIGHLLGADHDTVNSTCTGTTKNGLKTIMHPHVSLASKTWSKCSQAYFKEFFRITENCFLDEPEEHHFNVQDLLPGVMYNANFQCKYLFTLKSRECEMGSTCTSLNCYIPGYACIVTHTAPADGTRCGESMWCHNTKCLVVGERPGAIDGNWGEWSAWSDCTRTCGSGVASSVRNCDKPQPAHGGKNCADLIRFISEEVNVSFVGKPCETGRPSFRDIQCGEFNDWIYPEDGKNHTWRAHYFHEDNPCALYCVNEEKVVAALRPRVIDGTMCYRGIRDLCIAGTCKSLPCDLSFGSNAVEDACGVCHGDGTGCEFSQGVQTLPKLTKGLTKLVNVPAGTKNIKVEEMSPTSAKIVVRDKDTKEVYIKGKSLGIFKIPGTQAWLGMIKKDQQALHIPGPVSKSLSIWIHRLEDVTVKWSMALPAEQQRKPEFVWDFLKWGPCSAECGPGTQKSDPSCMEEKAGLVEDSFCADLQMPAAKVRPCEITKCIPRWMVGDWRDCENLNSQEKQRKRAVYCIKKIGEGEGESQIVPDLECVDPKPHSTESCENRKKREGNYLEEESMYKSDTSEYALHRKYDDYLKHFAALSVPQKKSETIPFHLVSSPHFRHYFHVLETPDDSDEDDSLNFNSMDNITDQIQNRVSSDFYKDTFSGHRIDVSHIISKLSVKKRKSVFFNNPKEINKIKQKLSDDVTHRSFEKKGENNQERDKARKINRRSNAPIHSMCHQSKILSPKKNVFFFRNKKLKDCRLSEHSRPNLMTSQIIKNKFPVVDAAWHTHIHTKRRRVNEKNINELYNLRLLFVSYKKPKRVRFYPGYFNITNTRIKHRNGGWNTGGYGIRKFRNRMLMWKSNQQKIHPSSLLRKKRKKYHKHRAKIFFSNSFGDTSDTSSHFKGRSVSEDFSIGGKSPQTHLKKTTQTEKRGENFNPTYKRLHKAKRSNKKWKKTKVKDTSKSAKDYSGNAYGTETRKYLNNLFRENRQRVTTYKPQKIVCLDKKPVIQVGKVITDRDSKEDKQMEILFIGEDSEEKLEKGNQLPRPPTDEKKICLKGQEVFDLIDKLQRRSCFYRKNNDTEEKVDMEVDVKVPKNSKGRKTAIIGNAETETVVKNRPTEAKTNSPTGTIPNSRQQRETTTTVHKSGKISEATPSNLKAITTQTQLETTSENTCKNATTEKVTIENPDTDENYDIDEIIPYPPDVEITTEEPEENKKKKKKKKKKLKYNGPILEDYEHDSEELMEQNTTNMETSSKHYDSRQSFKRRKRNRKWRRSDIFL